MRNIYIKPTSWGFAAYQYGKQLYGTERETKEEVEELDFEQILKNEKEKLLCIE